MSTGDFKQMVTPCSDPFPMNSDTEPAPAPTPRTDALKLHPDGMQHARFEGCDSVIIAPEDYATLYEHAQLIECELAQAQTALAAAQYGQNTLASVLVEAGAPDFQNAVEAQRWAESVAEAQAALAAKDRECAELADQLRIVVDAESFRARKIERERDSYKARAEKAEADYTRMAQYAAEQSSERLAIIAERDQLRAEIVEQANGYAATIADLNEQLAAKHLLGTGKSDQEVTGATFHQYFNGTPEQRQLAIEYVKRDIRLTRAIGEIIA